MKSVGYFLLAMAVLVFAAWIVSKITGAHAYYLEEWTFGDGETVIWRDDHTDTYLIPKLGQAAVMSFAHPQRGAVVVTNRRILIGSLPLFGKKHMVQYVIYPTPAGAKDAARLDGGLLSTGFQTLVLQAGAAPDAHVKETHPWVDLVPASGEASSTNIERVRIFTADAAGFTLPPST